MIDIEQSQQYNTIMLKNHKKIAYQISVGLLCLMVAGCDGNVVAGIVGGAAVATIGVLGVQKLLSNGKKVSDKQVVENIQSNNFSNDDNDLIGASKDDVEDLFGSPAQKSLNCYVYRFRSENSPNVTELKVYFNSSNRRNAVVSSCEHRIISGGGGRGNNNRNRNRSSRTTRTTTTYEDINEC
jgi:hypothetical protein